jgi:hypothetical protein
MIIMGSVSESLPASGGTDNAGNGTEDTTAFTVVANEAAISQPHDEILFFGQWVTTNGLPDNDAMWTDYGKPWRPINATCPPPPRFAASGAVQAVIQEIRATSDRNSGQSQSEWPNARMP